MKNEMVWVVKEHIINNEIGDINNFKYVNFLKLNNIFKKAFFMKREKAEHDENYKQIIPYTIFQNTNENYLLVKRTKNQSEKRLHNKLSIGIGGHINPIDKGLTEEMTFLNALNRENNEELDIDKLINIEYKGIIYDKSNSVSRVHLGILFKATVNNAKIKEKENFLSEWLDSDSLKDLKDENFETWSKIALKSLGVYN